MDIDINFIKCFKYQDQPRVVKEKIASYRKETAPARIIFTMQGGGEVTWQFINDAERDVVFEKLDKKMKVEDLDE